MSNTSTPTQSAEPGFLGMSHYADGLDDPAGNAGSNERAMKGADLQAALVNEIQARPLRAIGWAAVAGLMVGLWAAR